ncbi:MAG: ferredoxin [bacterium]|nr:ferredoxin [bacterium]
MPKVEERNAGELTVRIDRTKCAAFKDCLGIAPEAFELGEDEIVRFLHPETVDATQLVEACAVCPVQALLVFNQDGKQVVPMQ